jgi:hypothetical protein
MILRSTLAALLALALLAGCSHVSIGVGLPIGRAGGIFVGGTVPVKAPEPAASAPAGAASAPAGAASAASK